MSYRHTASRSTLVRRAELVAKTRAFFAARGVLEVETPVLSTAASPDPAVSSVQATLESLGRRPYFLHTSPEYPMKRLLAAGSGDIYQLCKVFRDGELGRWHQPEFTMLEWYRVGWTETRLMAEVESLCRLLLEPAGRIAATRRQSYAQVFQRALGIDPHSEQDRLGNLLAARDIDVPENLESDELLDLALTTAVIPSFPARTLTFVYDYPASQAALAEIKDGDPAVASRFEVFFGGVELANGFRELRDAGDQLRRFEAENARRVRQGRRAVPLDRDFIAALEAGLPVCAGVAMGFDRLFALTIGADELAAGMAFAHTRSD